MGSHNFTWDHPASEVYVTGTFDNWTKSEKLDNTGSGFAKHVQLPSKDKILYKFVVDGNWVTDHTAPSETDHDGNVNNVLHPHEISDSLVAGAGLGGAAGLAGGAALASHSESADDSHIPGSFPETPANELQQFSVNPIPATSGAGNPVKLAPGEKVPESSSYTENTISSTARDDPELKSAAEENEQTFGVKPIPATGGAGNPVSVAPGEKLPEPSSYTGNTLGNNVRLDKESYEQSDAGAPVLPPVLSKQEQAEANGASMFSLPPIGGGSLIPESSLPMGGSSSTAKDLGPTISSAGPQSTSAQLAGQQPIEPRGVPEVVTESQQKAHTSPEAASSPEAVAEKSQLEEELKAKVPEAPSTSESGVIGKSEKGYAGMAAGGLAAAGTAAAGLAYAAKDSVAPTSDSATAQGLSPNDVRGPAAPASDSTLADKAAVTDEIKDTVPTAPATSESGLLGKSENNTGIADMAAGGVAAAGATAAGAAYLARDKVAATTGKDPTSFLPPSVANAINSMNTNTPYRTTHETATTTTVPPVVTESQQEAHVAPEAAASPEAVREKSAFEKELLKEVPESDATGTPAPTISGTGESSSATATTTTVPSVVTQSQKEAHVGPEATASPEVVREKSAMEKELIKEIPTSNASGAPAPTISAATASSAPVSKSIGSGAPVKPTGSGAPVKPTGSGTPVKPSTPAGAVSSNTKDPFLNAPASAQASTPATAGAATSTIQPSRDVSPMSHPTTTTGTETSAIPTKTEPVPSGSTSVNTPASTPQKARPASQMFKDTPASQKTGGTSSPAASDATKKRRSFFGKLKDKLKG